MKQLSTEVKLLKTQISFIMISEFLKMNKAFLIIFILLLSKLNTDIAA